MSNTFLGYPSKIIKDFLIKHHKSQTIGGVWTDVSHSEQLSEYSTETQNRIWKNTAKTASLTFQKKQADSTYTVIYQPSYAGTVVFPNCDGTEKELVTMTRFGICQLTWQAN